MGWMLEGVCTCILLQLNARGQCTISDIYWISRRMVFRLGNA